MDEPRFDALSRWISPRLPRRSLIGLLAALALGGETPDGAVAKQQRGAKRRDRRKQRDRHALLQSLLPGVQGEVVGGAAVAQGTFDFATFVAVDLGNGQASVCTGSLITPRHVLTAAHCVVDEFNEQFHPDQFVTAVGRASIQNVPSANIRGVSAVFTHPNYDAETIRNDVAILQLEADVPASIARPVALVGSNDVRFDGQGQAATVAGWGRTSGGGLTSAQLLQAPLAVISDAACAQAISMQPDVQICASSLVATACNGDSGGPLFALTAAARQHSAAASRADEVHAAGKKGKKRRKRGKKRNAVPPVPPPPASPPAAPPATALIATQLGIVSFGLQTCPPGGVNVFTQLSAPAVRSFIAQVAGI